MRIRALLQTEMDNDENYVIKLVTVSKNTVETLFFVLMGLRYGRGRVLANDNNNSPYQIEVVHIEDIRASPWRIG